MADYMTEEQQVEALKKWWKEYGLSIVSGVILAIIIIFGWRFYKNYETQKAQSGSVVYARMTIDVMNNQMEDAALQANNLLKNFTSTPYAKIAAFTLAKQAVMQKKYDVAIKQLNWVIDHAKSDAFLQIAKIRLARIYIAQNKSEKALDLLQKVNDKSFIGLVAEVKGDAYTQLGKNSQARRMYKQALKEIPNPEQSRPMLRMKLEDL